MNAVEGVSVGTGSAALAYLFAKFDVFEKVYRFLKTLFDDKSTVNIKNVRKVGDVAGRDINKNKYDQRRHRSGDVYNVLSGPGRPVLKRAVRLQFVVSDPALQARLQRIWKERDLPGARNWFIDYANVVLDSDEFLERVEAEQELHAQDGWELESIDGFDNTWSDDNHGFHCQLYFVRDVPTGAASRPAV